jgi:hypothetical protein
MDPGQYYSTSQWHSVMQGTCTANEVLLREYDEQVPLATRAFALVWFGSHITVLSLVLL